ncbi:VaFE repeat-containing surface-anchored protein [Microbacterium esteraromaticum]|uniref:VaFE repeat-containing surface-anchored protein n=1 Tax=Microbacterium esteraromaticum TaxID=57043 RepID=A0A7D7WAJ0_9MICO|nr:VaFE repeat-containing surface-anchored protein [Microbacterium esteraromaticum]QMU96019.1 VaFE repeat-containing surface-anchored protein [Microbacterium esteraromaticum]
MRDTKKQVSGRWGRGAAALLLAVAAVIPTTFATAAAADEIAVGDSVWVGSKVGYSGGGYHSVYLEAPSDPNSPGAASFGAYCIEQPIRARTNTPGVVGDYSSYLGSNHFTSPAVQAKVFWVLAHSYPAVSLADMAAAAGLADLTLEEATQAAQYAIWRYTDLGFDADWSGWVSPNASAAYWYLVNGANADTATAPPASAPIEVSVSAPAAAGEAGTLYGPFTVSTNQPTASVVSDPAYPITDASGDPVDVDAVVDGQELYLDLTGVAAAGAATITATVDGASGTGFVITTPTTTGGTATPESHAQSLVLVAAAGATTSAEAEAAWSAAPVPSIGTSLVDDADQDRVLAWDGGTLVDTIAYENLTPGVQYTVAGELMLKSDGSATGVTGSTTFTPSEANGTVEVTFTVPTGFAGETLVAFEYLYEGAAAEGEPVAVHADIEDAAQTVVVEEQPAAPVPSIGTSLVDDADQDRVLAWDGGTLVDTIAYENLTPGAEYTVAGELMLKSDGSATGVTGSTTFTPSEANGTVEVTFTVPTGFAGETLVAFEYLYEGAAAEGEPVAVHADIEDAAQTVVVEEQPAAPVPSIGTSLVDDADQDRVLAWDGGTLVDTIAYENLTPGAEYTVAGELMLKSDGSATGVTGSTTFTPSEANGTVEVTFTVPTGFAGETLVAFEYLYEGAAAEGEPVAVHADIEDAAQTVVVEEQPAAPAGPGDDGGELAVTGGALPIGLTALGALALIAGIVLVTTRRRESTLL